MNETLDLACYGIACLALLAAIGSGIVSFTARATHQLLLAPIVGLGLSAAVLTSAAVIMPMKLAAFALLLPVALLSLSVTVARSELWRQAGWRWLGAAALAAAAAFSLAAFPGFVRDAAGPSGLAVYDSLIYVEVAEDLQDHAIRVEPDPRDLVGVYGSPSGTSHYRLGLPALNAAVASLLATGPDKTNFALLAVVFALLPLAAYAVARGLKGTRLTAFLAGAFVLSPTLLLLVADGAGPSLAAIVLCPPLLLSGVMWLRRRDWRALAVSACLFAGLMSIYPEFAPSVVVIGAIGLLVILVLRRKRFRQTLVALFVRASVLAVLIAALAPVGVQRGVKLLFRYGDTITGQPVRFLTFENSWAWTFGTLHLYELQRFWHLSDLEVAFALGVAALLALALAIGVFSSGVKRAAFILVPILVAVAVGLWTLERYQGGDCEYCLWKSLTLGSPFVALGLAFGVGALVAWRGRLTQARRIVAAVAVGLAAAAVVRSNVEIGRAEIASPAVVGSSSRGLGTLLAGTPPNARVLLEGSDTTSVPKWTVTTDYLYLSRRTSPGSIMFAPSGTSGVFLGIPADSGAAHYSPDYAFVVTRFGGMATGRQMIARRGPYSLQRRAPIDVSLVGAGWAYDPDEAPDAIPWVSHRFQLWISSLEYAGPVALTIGIERPLSQQERLVFWTDTAKPRVLTEGPRFCVEMSVARGLTALHARPVLSTTMPPAIRATESDPVPPPPKAVGINHLVVSPGACSTAT